MPTTRKSTAGKKKKVKKTTKRTTRRTPVPVYQQPYQQPYQQNVFPKIYPHQQPYQQQPPYVQQAYPYQSPPYYHQHHHAYQYPHGYYNPWNTYGGWLGLGMGLNLLSGKTGERGPPGPAGPAGGGARVPTRNFSAGVDFGTGGRAPAPMMPPSTPRAGGVDFSAGVNKVGTFSKTFPMRNGMPDLRRGNPTRGLGEKVIIPKPYVAQAQHAPAGMGVNVGSQANI